MTKLGRGGNLDVQGVLAHATREVTMATDNAKEPISSRPPDPFVKARVSDPSMPPVGALSLSGLLGDSDRPGRRRLYLTTRLDYYLEFLTDDVVAIEDIGPDQPPFIGLDATRVTLVRDAAVDYTRSQVKPTTDPFELQARAVRATMSSSLDAQTWEAECPGPSFWGDCGTDFGCGSEQDCPSGFTVCKPHTCNCTDNTCRTDCAQATCADTLQTCNTNCNQATCGGTCQTCNTNCGQATCGGTCQTCNTNCGQAGCDPLTDFGPHCPTFAQTHCPTCRAGCGP